jgi:hypothetical protein
LDREVVRLIGLMAQANVTWGAPRIRNELAKVGIEVAVSTVANRAVSHRHLVPRHHLPSHRHGSQGPSVHFWQARSAECSGDHLFVSTQSMTTSNSCPCT